MLPYSDPITKSTEMVIYLKWNKNNNNKNNKTLNENAICPANKQSTHLPNLDQSSTIAGGLTLF